MGRLRQVRGARDRRGRGAGDLALRTRQGARLAGGFPDATASTRPTLPSRPVRGGRGLHEGTSSRLVRRRKGHKSLGSFSVFFNALYSIPCFSRVPLRTLDPGLCAVLLVPETNVLEGLCHGGVRGLERGVVAQRAAGARRVLRP